VRVIVSQISFRSEIQNIIVTVLIYICASTSRPPNVLHLSCVQKPVHFIVQMDVFVTGRRMVHCWVFLDTTSTLAWASNGWLPSFRARHPTMIQTSLQTWSQLFVRFVGHRRNVTCFRFLPKLDDSLQRLHTANEAAVSWLMLYST